MRRFSRLASGVFLFSGLLILVSCTAQRELTITAKFLVNDQPIQCPPICVEVDNPTSGSDTTKPISFEICNADADCVEVESGQSAQMLSNATVRAPDGISRGEQLPTMEKESYLKFMEWGDGSTDNPREVGVGPSPADLTAYFAAWEPLTVATTATARGCGNGAGILLGTSSAWAPVVDQPEFQTVQGPVTDSHVSAVDLFSNHTTNDVNMWILLSREEQFNLLSEKNGELGHRPGQIEIEWEEGSWPMWAWPSPESQGLDEPPVPDPDDADIAWVKGAWIFDCAHQDDGIVQGAWTEIHPPIAVAVMRGTAQGRLFLKEDIATYFPELHEKATGIQGVQVDLWINGDAGPAVESVKCAKAWGQGAGCIATPVFDITGIYEFDIPLPPAPTPLEPEAQFRVQFLRLEPDQPMPEITPSVIDATTNQLHLRLDLSDYKDKWSTCQKQNDLPGENLVNCAGAAYGVTVIAGWEVFAYPTDLHRVRLMVNSIEIHDDGEGEDGDGEYKMWLEVGPGAALAGDPLNPATVALHRINPSLNSVEGNGETYPLIQNGNALVFFFNIRESDPASNLLSLYLHGYEDDPIWDDELRDLVRVFYRDSVVWEVSGIAPDWAPASYGMETFFGTVRANTTPPIPYSDPVPGDCSVPCTNHWFDYIIEEVPLP
jgi:hypothetical protein